MAKPSLLFAALLALGVAGCGDDDGKLSRAEIREIRKDCALEAYGDAQKEAERVPSSLKDFFEATGRGKPNAAEIQKQFEKVFAPIAGRMERERKCLRRAGVKPLKDTGGTAIAVPKR